MLKSLLKQLLYVLDAHFNTEYCCFWSGYDFSVYLWVYSSHVRDTSSPEEEPLLSFMVQYL